MCVSVAATRLACSSSFHILSVLLWKAKIVHQQTKSILNTAAAADATSSTTTPV